MYAEFSLPKYTYILLLRSPTTLDRTTVSVSLPTFMTTTHDWRSGRDLSEIVRYVFQLSFGQKITDTWSSVQRMRMCLASSFSSRHPTNPTSGHRVRWIRRERGRVMEHTVHTGEFLVETTERSGVEKAIGELSKDVQYNCFRLNYDSSCE